MFNLPWLIINTPVAQPARTIGAVPNPTPQAEKPKLDCSGVRVGSTLTHKNFGEGEVISLNGTRLVVAFGTAEKAFIFPEVIEKGFLKM